MKQVISFSRRTDGPAFYMDRLIKAIEKEVIKVQNPFNNKISKVSLRPEDIAGFVLWSKNFEYFLKKWDIFLKYIPKSTITPINKIPVYFQFTRNSIKEILEPYTPSLDKSFYQLNELIEITSSDHIIWRFDPIIFWKEDDVIVNNLNDFEEIASKFSENGVNKCIISFATYYTKVERRMKKYSFDYHKPTIKEMIKTAKELIIIANQYKIKIYSCCNPDLLKIPEISQAHCIDGKYLSKLWKVKLSQAKDMGQRETCGCTKSRDIGGYGKDWQCNHGCLYCYANPNQMIYEQNIRRNH